MSSDKYGVQSLGAGWNSQLAPDGSTVYYDDLGNFNVSQVGGTSMGSYDGNNFASMNGIDYTAADAAASGDIMKYINSNAKGLGTIASGAGLAMSAYDTFFGNTAKTNKLNQKVLKQQIANNDYTMGRKKEFDTMMSNVKVPTGLASTVKL